MLNLLATSGTLGYGIKALPDISLNWIGQLIRILIEGIGIVGVGIIVFTIILKAIALPLDIFSRINGKKQALIMERMRPQMEKLQKQYANDKTMYNQKVAELQRRSGYSILGSCLPVIVSLVIFIIVFQAFSTYSQYANLRSYNDMVEVYNNVVSSYVVDESNPAANSQGFLYEVKGDDDTIDYTVDYAKFTDHYNDVRLAANDPDWMTRRSEEEVFLALAREYRGVHTGYEGSFDVNIVNFKEGDELSQTAIGVRNSLVGYYLEAPAALEVKDFYEGKGNFDKAHNNSFLWVRNIWYPDSTLNREIPNFSNFKKAVSMANIGDDYEESFNKVTSALTAQKKHYNGYYVLIILSIALMLLQQWLSMRSNKSVNELSTVDGSGARTTKWMMIMMPIIYGVISFFYSASFSLYMITNTLFSLVTMLIINKLVDIWFKKMEASGKLEEYLNRKERKKKRQIRAR